jgi:hypothetical protein
MIGMAHRGSIRSCSATRRIATNSTRPKSSGRGDHITAPTITHGAARASRGMRVRAGAVNSQVPTPRRAVSTATTTCTASDPPNRSAPAQIAEASHDCTTHGAPGAVNE